MTDILNSVDWATFVAAVLSSSLLTAVVAPHVNWSIEKKKQDRARKLKLIEAWRDIADKYESDEIDILDHPEYKTLRQYLSADAIDLFETNKSSISIIAFKKGASQDKGIGMLLSEIKRIEKDWKVSL